MTKVEHFGLHVAAWALVLIAVVFWLWFGIGSAYVERLGPMNWVIRYGNLAMNMERRLEDREDAAGSISS